MHLYSSVLHSTTSLEGDAIRPKPQNNENKEVKFEKIIKPSLWKNTITEIHNSQHRSGQKLLQYMSELF